MKNLLLRIKEKRHMMMIIANRTGYISQQTIKCSQDLDKLIYEYQKLLTQNCEKSVLKNHSNSEVVKKFG
ncbi:aspartyl-phosphate phosphatase Spo0E family protein [Sutcliffiella deserti]|uniref:aspartyl-phosphate phosphatase Spo0E family protein n=1 Tax=Sutcliffiella deserti TaxID=2875501 RepID=UPI001CC07B52|nr:aspartyl-phosphate phosphatase Spo0E family protein [Sutcliffiella deserti]